MSTLSTIPDEGEVGDLLTASPIWKALWKERFLGPGGGARETEEEQCQCPV